MITNRLKSALCGFAVAFGAFTQNSSLNFVKSETSNKRTILKTKKTRAAK